MSVVAKAAALSRVDATLSADLFPRPMTPELAALLDAVVEALTDREIQGALESGAVVNGTLVLTMEDGRTVEVPLPPPSAEAPPPYVHSQGTPEAVWVISHSLGRLGPPITVLDSTGREVEGAVEYPDADTAVITFSAPFSGVAYVYP